MAFAPNLAGETDGTHERTGRRAGPMDRRADGLTFVLSTIQLQHELINLLLLNNTELLENGQTGSSECVRSRGRGC